jgi:hypothetical protein
VSDSVRSSDYSPGKAGDEFVGRAIFVPQMSPVYIVFVLTSPWVRIEWCRARHIAPAPAMFVNVLHGRTSHACGMVTYGLSATAIYLRKVACIKDFYWRWLDMQIKQKKTSYHTRGANTVFSGFFPMKVGIYFITTCMTITVNNSKAGCEPFCLLVWLHLIFRSR